MASMQRRGFVRWFILAGAAAGLILAVSSLRQFAEARQVGQPYHGGGEFLVGFPTSLVVVGLAALAGQDETSVTGWTVIVLVSLVGNGMLFGAALGWVVRTAWRALGARTAESA